MQKFQKSKKIPKFSKINKNLHKKQKKNITDLFIIFEK